MGLPRTSRSRTVTVRFANEKIDTVEATAAEHGLSRHALIKICVFSALETGAISELARAAQKVKAPL